MKKLLIIFLLAVAGNAIAQQKPAQFISGLNVRGEARDQLQIDSLLYLPLVDTTKAPGRSGVLVVKSSNNKMYFYDGVYYRLVINSSDTSSMLLNYLRTADTTNKWIGIGKRYLDTAYRVNDSVLAIHIRDGNGNGVTTTISIKGAGGSGGGGGGSGNTNSNIGSGFRLAIPNTNDIKTIFAAYGLTWDSTTNTNALTVRADTTNQLTSKLSRKKLADSLGALIGAVPTLQQVLTSGNQVTVSPQLIKGTGPTVLQFDSLTNVNWRHKGFFRIQADGGQQSAVFQQSAITLTAGDSVTIATPSTKFSVFPPGYFYNNVFPFTRSGTAGTDSVLVKKSDGSVGSISATYYGTGGGGSHPDSTFIKLGYLSVVDSGARGDGIIVQDASITSGAAILTTSTTNFTNSDVGKSVMVAGAGAAGADLYTTILTFNSIHNITLNANAGTTVSNKELDYGTDNSVAFQKCLNASLTSYIGLNKIVFVPLGAKPYFFFNPPVSSSIDGSNPYSQIYVPLAKYTPSDSLSSVTLMGQTPPNLYTDYTAGQGEPKSGVILQSVRRDSAASVLGSAYETVAWGDFNFVKFFMKNIMIRTRSMTNGVDVKPLMNALNASQISMLNMDNFRFDVQSSQATSVRPDTTTFGIKTPLNNNFADIHITNGLIQGYHSGIIVNEHTNVDNVIIATCYNALDFLSSFHSSNFGSILTIWNVNNLRILGATPIIMARWDIENYPSSASVKWFNHQYDVYEPTAVGALGKIAYTRIESGTGVSPLLDLSTNVDLKLNFTLIGDPSPNRKIGGLTNFYGAIGDDTYSILVNESTNPSGHGQPVFATKRLGAYLHGFGSDLGGLGNTNSYWYNYTRGMAEMYCAGDGSFAIGNNAQTAPYLACDVNGGFGFGGNALSSPVFSLAANAYNTNKPTFQVGNLNCQLYNNANTIIGFNLKFDGANFKYIESTSAGLLQSFAGNFLFGAAPSGTASGTATVSNLMFLSNVGDLYVGGNADNGYKLEVNGLSRFIDTGSLVKRFSYGNNIHSTFTPYSLVDKFYVDSSVAAGGGGGSDTLKVVNEGTPGIRLLRTGHDTLYSKILLGANSISASVDSDSTLRFKLVNDTSFTPTLTDYIYGWDYQRGSGALGFMNKLSLSGDLKLVQSSNLYQTTGTSYSSGGYDKVVRNISTGRYEIQQGAPSYFTPSTGGTVSLANNAFNIINPSGTLATLTVNLPGSPADGDYVEIKFTQVITAVTFANGTVADGITAPTAGGYYKYVYRATGSTWY